MDFNEFRERAAKPNFGDSVRLNLFDVVEFTSGMDSPAPTIDPVRFYVPDGTERVNPGIQVQGYIARITSKSVALVPEWNVKNNVPDFRAGGFDVNYDAIHSIESYQKRR